MAEQKATNVTWHDGEVSREHRYLILRQKGVTIWFTGLSGSGKSTIAVALEQALFNLGKLSYRLDGDNVRLGINKNLGFSEEDRKENIRRIGEIAKLFGDAGTIALSSFISPYKADRDEVRRLHEAADLKFVEVDLRDDQVGAIDRPSRSRQIEFRTRVCLAAVLAGLPRLGQCVDSLLKSVCQIVKRLLAKHGTVARANKLHVQILDLGQRQV